MSHWRSVLPVGAMLEVDYEALVADVEHEAERMIDFCGLPWDPACLAFHTNARPVHTISAAQVREPLYMTSIGRSRRYAAWLAPLQRALAKT